VLYAHESDGSSRATLGAAIPGFVGDSLARAFLRTYRSNGGIRMPSVASLLASYSKGRSEVLAMVKTGDTARLNALCRGIMLHLQEPANEAMVRSDAKAMADLAQLVADLPADLRRKVHAERRWIPQAPRKPRSKVKKTRGK
jgi:hypothetical protein